MTISTPARPTRRLGAARELFLTMFVCLGLFGLSACSDPEPPPPECTVGTDCESGVCQDNECQVASCIDGVANGMETDVDCGGTCKKCELMQGCMINDDCKSKNCVGGVCSEKKGIGEACASVDECDAAYQCRVAGDAQICTLACTTDCPTGFSCFRQFCVPDAYCEDPDGDGYGVGPGCTGTICDLCDDRATCVEQEDFSFACVCNEGYVGDGETCDDYDECGAGTDNCDTNASCENTDGSFECTCADGFEGDGVTCEDIDECVAGTDNCDDKAICTNLDGGFFCSCPPGSNDVNGDGTVCSNVDECILQTDDCDENAACINTEDAWTCECNEGWVDANPNSPGRTCMDVDECSAGLDNCDPSATCNNEDGGFSCTCPAGTNDVNGDGTVCRGEDKCMPRPTDCADNATCRNSTTDPRGYVCLCPDGYRDVNGDGSQCQEIDECAEELDSCDDDYATCTNTPGSFTCACNSGYFDVRGNGSLCTNINECVEGTDNCDNNASCTDTNGSFECECDPLFIGDGVTCRRPWSCLELLQDQPGTRSGLYTIDTGMGGEQEVYCDMSTDGGGWTFLKVDHGTPASAQVAENFCANRGMRLFIPRNKDHLSAAYSVATNSNIGPGGDPNYMRILGIYPKTKGATCLTRAFTSSTAGCNWRAGDNGDFYVSERTDITEPNGDNDINSSMYYSWLSGARVQWYNDIPMPGYTSRYFMCDTADKN